MELNFRRYLRKLIIVMLIVPSIFSCGTNYYYNKEGGLRPQKNNFDLSNLESVNYKIIDTNAIYISSDNWFYKFYSNKKVGFGFLDNDLSLEEILNPRRLKMGYFEINEKQITTYIYINKGNKKFFREKITLDGESIIKENEMFVKEKIKRSVLNLSPDW